MGVWVYCWCMVNISSAGCWSHAVTGSTGLHISRSEEISMRLQVQVLCHRHVFLCLSFLFERSFEFSILCICPPPSFCSLPFFCVLLSIFLPPFLPPSSPPSLRGEGGWHHQRAAGCCYDVEMETWKMCGWHLPLMQVWLHCGCHGYTACVVCCSADRTICCGKLCLCLINKCVIFATLQQKLWLFKLF